MAGRALCAGQTAADRPWGSHPDVCEREDRRCHTRCTAEQAHGCKVGWGNLTFLSYLLHSRQQQCEQHAWLNCVRVRVSWTLFAEGLTHFFCFLFLHSLFHRRVITSFSLFPPAIACAYVSTYVCCVCVCLCACACACACVCICVCVCVCVCTCRCFGQFSPVFISFCMR